MNGVRENQVQRTFRSALYPADNLLAEVAK